MLLSMVSTWSFIFTLQSTLAVPYCRRDSAYSQKGLLHKDLTAHVHAAMVPSKQALAPSTQKPGAHVQAAETRKRRGLEPGHVAAAGGG